MIVLIVCLVLIGLAAVECLARFDEKFWAEYFEEERRRNSIE